MLSTIERQEDARRINEIVNHPEVKPWVQGTIEGEIDLTEVLKNPNTLVLLGEHGGVMFHRHMPGIWVAHTQVLPEGRGPWATLMAQACMHALFTCTEATELLTMCPKGNIGAKAMARQLGLRYEFTKRLGWTMNGEVVPVEWYGIRIQDWMATAPGLSERGHWFHEKLEKQMALLGKQEPQHDDDLAHDRYVGAAYEMAKGGQPEKGVFFYNRWASLSGYAPIYIAQDKPLTVNIGNARIIIRDNGDFIVANLES
jgi:hypothetical protein